MTRILGIDPGSRATGFGVIEAIDGGLRYVGSGVVRTEAGDFPSRLREIFERLGEIVVEYRPAVAAVEQVFVRNNPDSALKLGQARGAALCACVVADLPVAEYAPRAIKQAVVGRGGADKSQVQYMVRALLRLGAMPPSDAADALAVAVCHAHSDRLQRRLGVAARP